MVHLLWAYSFFPPVDLIDSKTTSVQTWSLFICFTEQLEWYHPWEMSSNLIFMLHITVTNHFGVFCCSVVIKLSSRETALGKKKLFSFSDVQYPGNLRCPPLSLFYKHSFFNDILLRTVALCIPKALTPKPWP